MSSGGRESNQVGNFSVFTKVAHYQFHRFMHGQLSRFQITGEIACDSEQESRMGKGFCILFHIPLTNGLTTTDFLPK
jgi:hypothetical protein